MGSLQSHFDSFYDYLLNTEFEFMVLGGTETAWSQDSVTFMINMGICLAENHRSKSFGGGVGIYLQN